MEVCNFQMNDLLYALIVDDHIYTFLQNKSVSIDIRLNRNKRTRDQEIE